MEEYFQGDKLMLLTFTLIGFAFLGVCMLIAWSVEKRENKKVRMHEGDGD